MDFEWDPQKAAANFKKHGVDFADAATVLTDDSAVTILDDGSVEERHATIGVDALGRVLVVIYAWRGDRIRLISAARRRGVNVDSTKVGHEERTRLQ